MEQPLFRMLNFVLIGVALGLLYSVEVGKVHGGQFGGIEPEELRELLSGKFVLPVKEGEKLSEHEELVRTLLQMANEQLESLGLKEREEAVRLLLEYLGKKQGQMLDSMLQPANVYVEVLQAMAFDPNKEAGVIQA